MWGALTKKLSGVETRVTQLHGCQVEWLKKPDGGLPPGGWNIKELAGTDFVIDADLVLVAMGFVHVVHEGLVKALGLKLDSQGNIAVNNYQTNEPLVFAAGDTVSGASLVVRAINSGREAAAAIDQWLKK